LVTYQKLYRDAQSTKYKIMTTLFTPINIKQYFLVPYLQMLILVIFIAHRPR